MQLYNIRLRRQEASTNWGFRLEGGLDTPNPIYIKNVISGSLADCSGLKPGDRIIRINQSETQWMKHENAKMEIIRSNNELDLFVERPTNSVHFGPVIHANYNEINENNNEKQHYKETDQSWINKPNYTSNLKNSTAQKVLNLQVSPNQNFNFANLKTNLNSNRDHSIGVSHNVLPTPFGQSSPKAGTELTTCGSDGRIRRITHSNYNSPMKLYTQKHCNQTFEHTLNMANEGSSIMSNDHSKILNFSEPTKSMYCGSCGNFIQGKVVKVQGRIPMHPECLKCCKCGIGLRNVGYFYINDKLYCEIHAKQAAPPPEPGMKAVVVYK